MPTDISRGRGKSDFRVTIESPEFDVGDSVFVPDSHKRVSVSQVASAKLTGRKFTLRTVEGGCRVWRIA